MQTHRIEIKQIYLDELEKVLQLQNLVYHALSDKSLFFRDTREDIVMGLNQGGYLIGCYDQEKLIGYRYTSYPSYQKKNLAYELEIPMNDLPHVLQLESTVIHPEYRGHHLQKKTFEHLEKLLQKHDQKDTKYMVCTISPFNLPSLKNMLSCGFKIMTYKKMYATEENPKGLMRYVLLKEIR